MLSSMQLPMLKVGATVPDFTLMMCMPGETVMRPLCESFRLSDRLKGGDIVIVFVGGAFFGDCTREVCDFRDNLTIFQEEGYGVYAFNTLGHFWNAAFIRSTRLNFPIICDAKNEIAPRIWDIYNASPVPFVLQNRSARHGLMIISKDGRVAHVATHEKPETWLGLEKAFQGYEPRSRLVQRILTPGALGAGRKPPD